MFHKLPILKFFLENTFHLFGCRVHGKNDSLGVHEESSAGSVRYPGILAPDLLNVIQLDKVQPGITVFPYGFSHTDIAVSARVRRR